MVQRDPIQQKLNQLAQSDGTSHYYQTPIASKRSSRVRHRKRKTVVQDSTTNAPIKNEEIQLRLFN